MIKLQGDKRGFENVLVQVIMLVMLFVLSAQIVSRFIPGLSLPWTLELITFLFGALVWIGISIAIKDNAHIGITFFIDRLFTKKGRKIIYIIQTIIFGLYIIAIGWMGTQSLIFYISRDIRTPAMQLNYAVVRSPMILGCLLSLYRLFEKLIVDLKTRF